ncbi:SpoIIE-like protein phosphatase domain protein [Leptospira fainei serovar Hurstbridge str. BUT 6]|uniref:SpoIIE-like protein phosphatase domain protein n=1 Tax=Leptospira fainei serovar Hurstbridge str. BUT 6 TaxID=1193011 RepID=S3VZ61_9LEPT|nr:PP2C family protein-serine/threonine phosphatase [Leptospira fainei]EPG73372.1 SpoIIE-like protein phosphatase domain protein [Leptospira fainei serovar Hurstbridge str. BUT 6]
MRNILLVFVSVILFGVILFAGLLKSSSKESRLPFYFYPNGMIALSVGEYTDLIGLKIDLLEYEISRKLGEDNAETNRTFHFYGKDRSVSRDVSFIFRSAFDVLRDFSWDIGLSLLYFSVAIWFFFYTRDLFIFLLFGSFSSLFLFNFFLLAFQDFVFPFFFFLYFSGFLILDVSYRLRGKEIPSRWFAPQVIFSIVASYVGASQKANPDLFQFLSNAGIHFNAGAAAICILQLIFHTFRNPTQFQAVFKKLCLVLAFFLATIVPFFMTRLGSAQVPLMIRPYLIVAFLLFPPLVIYGTYTYSLVPVQIAFSSSLTSIYSILILTLGYLFGLEFFVRWNPEFLGAHQTEWNLFYVILSAYFLSPLNNKLYSWIDYWSFRNNPRLHTALEELSVMIGAPISMRATINNLIRRLEEALEVYKLQVLIPADKFPRTDLRNMNFVRIPFGSEIWKYFEDHTEVTVTSHLAYGLGIRESVFKFLHQMEVQLAYPLFNFERGKEVIAVFLVGEKRNRRNFTLGELRFLKECTRLASLLIRNYSLLVDEVEKKRIVRDLNMASILDKTLHLPELETIPETNVGYFSIPAVGISGDYLDILRIDPKRQLLILGDVSGHGLGSGYLVSAVRGIIRRYLGDSSSLPQIFRAINLFLIERYRGSEFMTSIAGVYNSSDGAFSFVNAGHTPPICIRKGGRVELRNETQRVLGVLPTDYKLLTIHLNPGDKLVLFTDGVTETFNDNEEIFGEENLQRLLSSNHHLGAQELADLVRKTLEEYRNNKEPSDDVSFICLEVFD